VQSWSSNCHPRKQKLRFACRRVSRAQSGCLSTGSQLASERRQSAMRPRLFWLSVHGGQRQAQQRQSATRVCLVGCLSVDSQRVVVCNGCCRRKGIPSPWLRHRDLVCLAGFVRTLWRELSIWRGSGFASGIRLSKPAARTRVHADVTRYQACGGHCLQALEARQNQATVFGIRPHGAGQDRSKNRGS
jgi:hypothetical protein